MFSGGATPDSSPALTPGAVRRFSLKAGQFCIFSSLVRI
jgi:hypothetical protein